MKLYKKQVMHSMQELSPRSVETKLQKAFKKVLKKEGVQYNKIKVVAEAKGKFDCGMKNGSHYHYNIEVYLD